MGGAGWWSNMSTKRGSTSDRDGASSTERTPAEGDRASVDEGTSAYSRRTALALLGLGGLGAVTGLVSAQPGSGNPGRQPWHDWQRDVTANGHGLLDLGQLTMTANQTPITDFAGANLSVGPGGVLQAADTRVAVEAGGTQLVSDAETIDFGDGLSATVDGADTVRVSATTEASSGLPPLGVLVDDFEGGSLDHLTLSDPSAFSLSSAESFHGGSAARVTTADPALAVLPGAFERGFEYRGWYKSIEIGAQVMAFVFGYQDEDNFYALMLDKFGGLELIRREGGSDRSLSREPHSIGAGSRWLQPRVVWTRDGEIFGQIYNENYLTDRRDYTPVAIEVRAHDETFQSGRLGFGLIEGRDESDPADFLFDYVTRRPL